MIPKNSDLYSLYLSISIAFYIFLKNSIMVDIQYYISVQYSG